MPFPRAAVAAPAELPVRAFDGPAAARGFALAGAREDDPEAWGAAAFDGPAVAPGAALAGAGEDEPEANEVNATPPVHIFR